MAEARLALVIESLDRGGAQKQLCLLLAHLDREAFAPVVVSLAGAGPWSAAVRALGVPLVELSHAGSPARRLAVLARTLRALRPDLVQTFLLFDNLYGAPAARLARVPRLVASRRYDPDGVERGLAHTINRALLRLADAIVCNTVRAVRAAPPALAGRHVTIPNAVVPTAALPRDAARAALGLQGTDLVVGNVGRVVPAKNPRLFAAIADAVRRRRPAARFVWIGGGPLAPALAAHPGVTVAGDRPVAAALLPALDVFLVSSDREGMSNALMEALAAPLPCVVTDAGGNAELVADGRSGYVRPVGDTAGLAARVDALLDDPHLCRAIASNARRRMQMEFTAPRMAAGMHALYRSLLGGQAPAATHQRRTPPAVGAGR